MLENNEQSHALSSDSRGTLIKPEVSSGNKIKKLKIGWKNGDKVTLHMESSDGNTENLREIDKGLNNADSNTKFKAGSADGQEFIAMGSEGTVEDVKTSCRLDLGLVLKKVLVYSSIFSST